MYSSFVIDISWFCIFVTDVFNDVIFLDEATQNTRRKKLLLEWFHIDGQELRKKSVE